MNTVIRKGTEGMREKQADRQMQIDRQQRQRYRERDEIESKH